MTSLWKEVAVLHIKRTKSGVIFNRNIALGKGTYIGKCSDRISAVS